MSTTRSTGQLTKSRPPMKTKNKRQTPGCIEVPVLSYPEPDVTEMARGAGNQRIAAWGIIKYEDAFKTERTCKFGLTDFRIGETQWMSQDTSTHNDSD